MKRFLCIAALSAVALLVGCRTADSLFSDPETRSRALADFERRSELLARCDALRVADDPALTEREREALRFLYAYMPLSDALNYDGDYFLRNVRLTERTRREMPWSAAVPADLYRHFVLPVRANNEDLDDFRERCFDELSARVRGLSMTDAVLEVNRWCHEKATYTPTDSRTASPLSTIHAAAGRCGEEAALLVAALRTVGIPARQVYTPRWAHTDDNHAWVEAWADGAWHFLGACEPEPVLDLGWFNEPASRGMLICTNVFGYYEGPEPVLHRTALTTTINITANYAPTETLHVQVVDAAGTAVPDATVEYKLYNYAELYTVATQTSDSAGRAAFTAGRGDLVVWASKEGRYGVAKASVGEDAPVTVRLDRTAGDVWQTELTLVPPPDGGTQPPVSASQREENTRRLAVGDSLRAAHVATFRTKAQAAAFAREKGLDTAITARHLEASKGNWPEVESFLTGAAADGLGDRALMLLGMLTEKDLHDTPQTVLDDHLRHATSSAPWIMNPRVGTELLSAWRGFLLEQIPEASAARFRADPQTLVAWCRDSLRLADAENLRLVPIRPRGVWASRVADGPSRDLFFVAVCRCLGIPAWLDGVTGDVWYTHGDGDRRVDFTTPSAATISSAATPSGAAAETTHGYGRVRLRYTPSAALPDPRYYTHFTLSRLENGRLRLLNYGEEDSWDRSFRDGVGLEAGDYVLVNGTREDDGTVHARMQVFTIPDEETAEETLDFPSGTLRSEPLGTLDTSVSYLNASGASSPLSGALGEGYSVVGILGAGEEPTNHALHDLADFRAELEGLGAPIVLLFGNETYARRFEAAAFPPLPGTVQFGTDAGGAVRRGLESGCGMTRTELPLIAVVDGTGNIRSISSGYTIGLGERLTRVLTAE